MPGMVVSGTRGVRVIPPLPKPTLQRSDDLAISGSRMSMRSRSLSRQGRKMTTSHGTSVVSDDDGFDIYQKLFDDEDIDLDWEFLDTVTCSFNFPEWTLEQSILPHHEPSPLLAKESCVTMQKPSCPPPPEPDEKKEKQVSGRSELPATSASRSSSIASSTTISKGSQRPFQARHVRSPSDTTTGSVSEKSNGELRLGANCGIDDNGPSTPSQSTVNLHDEEPRQANTPQDSGASKSMDIDSGREKRLTIERSHIEAKPIPAALGRETLGKQDLLQSPLLASPGGEKAFEGASNVDSASPCEGSSRSPSPWNNASGIKPSEKVLSRSHLRSHKFPNSASSQHNVDSSPEPSEANSPKASGVESFTPCLVECAGGSSPAAGSKPGVTGENSSATPVSLAGSKRRYDRISTERDPNGDDDEDPARRRLGPVFPEEQPFQRRFACPYQKYDPEGSPKCCMPGPRNSTGGVETFSRVKTHVLRNHNPFIWCRTCWKVCRSEDEAESHQRVTDCVQKDAPDTKYWITEEQRDQIKQRKFLAGNEANWFCLFKILLPQVPEDGPNGYKKYSPYYTITQLVYGLPTPMSEPSPGPVQTRSSTEQVASSTPYQSSPCNLGPDAEIGPIFEGFDMDMGTGDIIQWDDLGGGLNSFINDNETLPEPENAPHACPIPGLSKPPGAPSQPACERTGPGGGSSSNFLQQDNARLKESNEQLQDEVEMLRRQTSDLRAQLQPLDRSLQELLYMPSVQSGDGEVVDRLFSICHGVTAMRKTLGARVGAG